MKTNSLLDDYAEMVEKTHRPMVDALERHNRYIRRVTWVFGVVMIGAALIWFVSLALLK
jgi:hypothetical protein